MEQIRVELTSLESPLGNRTRTYSLSVMIGDRDVTEQVGDTRMIAFRSYLPPADRGYMPIGSQRVQTLATYLRRGQMTLAPAVLAEAVRSYVTEISAELTQAGQPVSSGLESDEEIIQRLTAAEPGYLTIGGRSFRLQSAGEVSAAPGKMLIQLRQKAAESVRRERDALIAGARREAEIVRRQVTAERSAWHMEREQQRQQIRAERAGRRVPPAWIPQEMPVKWIDDSTIAVLQAIQYRPTRFTFPGWPISNPEDGIDEDDTGPDRGTLEWDAVPQLNPVYTWIWVPFSTVDGMFNMNGCHVASWSSQLPHASHSGFCCQPQGVPENIRSIQDLSTVIAAINRAFKEVNLSSLLVSEDGWQPAVLAFMPQLCREFMRQWRDEGVSGADWEQYGARVQQPDTAQTVWGR